jgi:hypothetical protein
LGEEKTSVADPDPARKKIQIRDRNSPCFHELSIKNFRLKILNSFDADPDPGSGAFLTLDPRWKNLNPVSGINIPDSKSI